MPMPKKNYLCIMKSGIIVEVSQLKLKRERYTGALVSELEVRSSTQSDRSIRVTCAAEEVNFGQHSAALSPAIPRLISVEAFLSPSTKSCTTSLKVMDVW